MTTFVVPTEAPKVHDPPQGQWTFADWERLPDDENCYEIIDGVRRNAHGCRRIGLSPYLAR